MPLEEGLGQPEFGTGAADFVLEEGVRQLDEFEIYAFEQASDVVAFDFAARVSVRRYVFDGVGIGDSLREGL